MMGYTVVHPRAVVKGGIITKQEVSSKARGKRAPGGFSGRVTLDATPFTRRRGRARADARSDDRLAEAGELRPAPTPRQGRLSLEVGERRRVGRCDDGGVGRVDRRRCIASERVDLAEGDT